MSCSTSLTPPFPILSSRTSATPLPSSFPVGHQPFFGRRCPSRWPHTHPCDCTEVLWSRPRARKHDMSSNLCPFWHSAHLFRLPDLPPLPTTWQVEMVSSCPAYTLDVCGQHSGLHELGQEKRQRCLRQPLVDTGHFLPLLAQRHQQCLGLGHSPEAAHISQYHYIPFHLAIAGAVRPDPVIWYFNKEWYHSYF